MTMDVTTTGNKSQEISTKPTIHGKEVRSCITLGIGTICVFSAFMALQNLQGSLNDKGGLGVISLGCLYAAAIVSAVNAPLVISVFGTKHTVIMAFLGHLVYVTSNFYSSFYTLIPSSLLIGLITGPLWTSYGTYLTICAASMSTRTGVELHVALSKLNGVFFGFFESSCIVGNLLSSIVLYQGTYNTTLSNTSSQYCGVNNCQEEETDDIIASPDSQTVYIMLGVFLALVLAGIIVVTLFLIPVNSNTDKEPNKNVKQSLMKLGLVMMKTDIKFLLPLCTYIAVKSTFCFAELTTSFISCPLGIENVGYVMSVFGFCAACVASVSSVLGKFVRRYVLLTVAAIMELSLLLWMYTMVPGRNDYVKIYILSALLGITQGVWKAQLSALVGDIFADYRQEAFALIECFKFIGFTLSFTYSSLLCMTVKIAIAITLLSIGIILYALVEIRFVRKSKGTCRHEIIVNS